MYDTIYLNHIDYKCFLLLRTSIENDEVANAPLKDTRHITQIVLRLS